MNKINEIKNLTELLNHYTKYYEQGNPLISDKEWDDLYFRLVELEKESNIYLKDSPTQSIFYKNVNSLNKVKHNHEMLSLDKTKDIEVIKAFVKNHDYIVMPKMDGLTCSLKYIDGKLISAETRGDGIEGEDITHNAFVIPSIPKVIPYTEELVVDGEIICKFNDFQEFSGSYKNPRNFAAGSIRLLNSEECEKRKLTFVAWDVINDFEYCETLSQKLIKLIQMGFETVTFFPCRSTMEIEHWIEAIPKHANQDNYPIDGLVFKYDNCKEYQAAGKTDHHFRGGLAFKLYDETYETKLIDIEYTMGRTGVLTPVAIFEPVEIDGCEVTRASLHNLSIMEELFGTICPEKNTIINTYKANQIIPQIKNVVAAGDGIPIHIPEICPICGGQIKQETLNDSTNLICINPLCEGKLINRLDHFCGKKGLDIRGLSKATLEKLIDWEWVKSYEDIFNLNKYKIDWINKPGFGEKSVSNILEAIEQGKNCSLDKFICALGIPLIGTVASKEIIKYFPTWYDFIDAVENNYHFWDIPNFGIETHNAIKTFDYEEAKRIYDNFLNIEISYNEETQENTLDNLSFVITGKLSNFKNRDELKTLIESKGGKVVGSISSKTSYLINNDVNSTSSKNISAKKLNIPIISEEQFIEMIR